MGRGRRLLVLTTILLSTGLACAAGWLLFGETLITSGIDAFFGQAYLTRESAPLPPRKVVSNQVLTREEMPSSGMQARWVVLPGEATSWGPAYPGFADTLLTEGEVTDLLAAMADGSAFISPDTRIVLCIVWPEGGTAEARQCQEGAEARELHDRIRMSASRTPGIYALQLRSPQGALAEYRFYSADGMLAYSSLEPNEPAIEGILSVDAALLDALAARAAVRHPDVIWPGATTEEANARAARRLGRRYEQALEVLRGLESLSQILGEVDEFRPVEGQGGNWSSTWMDSQSMQLLLWVRGGKGEGVVRMSGWDCWEAELAAEGRLVDLTSGIVCPPGSG